MRLLDLRKPFIQVPAQIKCKFKFNSNLMAIHDTGHAGDVPLLLKKL